MRIPAVDRLVSVLAYLPVIPWFMWKVRRHSLFAQFNIRQGSVLSALWILVTLIGFAVAFFVPTQVVEVGSFIVFFAATLAYIWFGFWGIVKVLQGERYRMPVVADVALALRL